MSKHGSSEVFLVLLMMFCMIVSAFNAITRVGTQEMNTWLIAAIFFGIAIHILLTNSEIDDIKRELEDIKKRLSELEKKR